MQSEYDYSRVSGAACYDSNPSGGYTFSVCDSNAKALYAWRHRRSGRFGHAAMGLDHERRGQPFTNLATIENGIGNTSFNAGVADTNCDGVANAAPVNTGNLSFNDAGSSHATQQLYQLLRRARSFGGFVAL